MNPSYGGGQPQTLSNAFDDFVQGGLYPGGTGIVRDIAYAFWDYGGTQPPNSICAVHMTFQPTDGSNEGKVVDDIYWSVGPSSDFQPVNNGASVASTTRAGLPSNSNWGDVCERLKMSCGLDGKHLNGPNGIRALIGGEMTLTRVPQKERAGLEDNQPPPVPGQQPKKTKKRDILVPTRFRGAWEMQGGQGQGQGQGQGGMPQFQPPTPAPMQMPTQGQFQPHMQQSAPAFHPPQQFQPPPPPQQNFQPLVAATMPGMGGAPATPITQFNATGNPAVDGPALLTAIVTSLGGLVPVADISRQALDRLVSIDPVTRMSLLTALSPANIQTLAAQAGLMFDGQYVRRQG